MIINVIFYVFSLFVIVGSLSLITSKNPVKAVISMVITFVFAAGIWLTMQQEYLALLLIVVYVGAVLVMFMFVVMMLDIEIEIKQSKMIVYWPLAVCICIILSLLIAIIQQMLFLVHKCISSITVLDFLAMRCLKMNIYTHLN